VGNAIVGVWLLGIVQETEMRIQALAFLVPLDVGLIGICIGLDSRKIPKERHEAINTYERPRIVHMPEVLFNDMAETAVGIEKINDGGAHGSKAILDYVYKRSQWHMEAMRLLTLQFLGPGLSERHKELDHALVDLGKVSFPQDADGVQEMVRSLESIMGIVVQVIKDIRGMPRPWRKRRFVPQN